MPIRIQRKGPRPCRRGRGSATAHQSQSEAADRLSHRLGRRVRVAAAGQEAAPIILPITFVLIMVLLYGLFNSFRDSLLALLGLPFAVGGGIFGLYAFGLNFSISAAIGFVSLFGVSSDERHPYHPRILSSCRSRLEPGGSHVSCGRPADATDPDDPVGLHRPSSGRALHRYRQPGAAATRDGDRGRNVDRAGHVARHRAGSAELLPRVSAQNRNHARRKPRRHSRAQSSSLLRPSFAKKGAASVSLVKGCSVIRSHRPPGP